MGAAIALREDYDAADLRRIAKGSKDAAQSRRLLSLAEIYAGGRRTDAARIGATDFQVIRDWVLRFNALGPSGLLDRKAPGNPPKLDTAQRQALAAIVGSGPIPVIHGVVGGIWWHRACDRWWWWQELCICQSFAGCSEGKPERHRWRCGLRIPKEAGRVWFGADS